MKYSLGELLEDLLTQNVSLEIDPGKLRDVENAEEICKNNQTALKEWTHKFLNRIRDKEVVKRMPHQLRIVAVYIAQEAESLNLDAPILIGAYLMLRFFNPAIATPEVFGIIDPKIKTKVGQRNLILITKLLQVSYTSFINAHFYIEYR